MRLRWVRVTLLVLVTAAAAKVKKHKHQKPGRAVLDLLSSSTLSEPRGGSSGGVTPSQLRAPAPLDVAPYAALDASATCGDQAGLEDYCREMPAKRGVVCGVCEGEGGASSRQHPPRHAVDADPDTWWQSPTLASGDQYRHVHLQATLPDVMELLHVIIKSGPSPRPLAWSLEVSTTEAGDDWRLLRAFGDKEHCRRLWDLRPERRRRRVRRGGRAAGGRRTGRADKPTCSTQFTSPRPLENGEMHVALGGGGGVSARRVRISFRGLHPAPPERQYYTVRALTLAARCSCHSHAEHCTVDAQGARCSCLDGTCGAHCERCCDESAAWSALVPCDVTGAGAALDEEPREGCGCGERGHCHYDDTGAILCVNCTENRAGPLCDRCLPGHYSVTPDGPCLPCGCDKTQSHGSCSYDRKRHRVSCECRAGVTGAACDSCADPDAMFPDCDVIVTTRRCHCDPRGILDPNAVCDDVCECKSNVIGERCDACAPGHYGLSEGLAGGCRPCYCSSITDQCAPDPSAGHHMALDVDSQAWLVRDVEGNQTLAPSLDDLGKPYLISYEVEGWDSFYWSTSTFKSGLSSYGGAIRATLYWSIVRGDTGGNPTDGPDIILLAADGTMLAYGEEVHETAGELVLVAPLVEGHWRLLQPGHQRDGHLVSRTQLMNVLRDVSALMIRAHFHWDQDEVRLESVEVFPSPPLSREVCTCPPGYEGAWCERCAWTHVRVMHAHDATPPFECVPCACHGHAACDTVDGPCGPCQHNTTGPHCERCLAGHYGNPVQGGCKPCACPLYLPSNNFSPLCALSSPEEDDFVCTQCPDGYTGDRCEHCDFGYWGSPTEPGSSCRRCECGGSPCSSDTGLCLKCPPHAEGARCDQCEEGYYLGDIDTSVPQSVISCVPCACGAGALSGACEPRGGQCACGEGWGGRACDGCLPGHGGVAEGCPRCQCGTAALDALCDVTTGSCACAPGALPPLCDQCQPEHYNLDVTGCLGCNCSYLGSESNVCDIRSGQCRCKPHVTGRACDLCEEGYWGLQADGCRRCACGAGAAACDPGTGACACARGVTGTHCDTCLPGFYGFGPNGCLPCPECEEGKVCDAATGRCTCPSGAQGPHCRQCARGYWGRAPRCQRCRCGHGAVSATCDLVSGACECRTGWAGARCDTCAPGHFGGRCKPCGCDPAGALDDSCDEHGNCACKENVSGAKCSACREGTFGLSADSPTGCTACFCFGRSAHCTQAGLTRAAIHVPAPKHLTLILQDTFTSMEQESLLAIHTEALDATIAVPRPAVPVYMELDQRFLGDRVTSYGGALRFRVEEEGGEELPHQVTTRFPLVRVYGRQNVVLDYYQRDPAINGTHSVRLHESLWQVVSERGSLPASRAALMVLLQHVHRIMLRVTTRAPTRHENVHALLLNVSLDTAVPGMSRTAPARGVELCSCPAGYAAPSCQQPALGFWMPPQHVHITTVAGTIVIDLEGDVKPCHCNGRATHCDPNTGHCLNCSGGTGGPRCEVCAEGYHGAPGAPGGCQACPCPERARNFASACAFSQGRLQCLCKPGYAGEECEHCAPSYKRSRDGSCVPCDCDQHGSLSQHCNASGRCSCREFATGARCDQCRAERTFLAREGCLPCDNCTQTLLDSISQVTRDLHRGADVTELSHIPAPYPALRHLAHNCTSQRTQLHRHRQHETSARTFQTEVQGLEAHADRLSHRATQQLKQALLNEAAANSLSLESMTGLEEVADARRRVADTVLALDEFAQGERHLSAHRALKEATRLLRGMRELDLLRYVADANDVFDKATLQHTSIQEYSYQVEATAQRVHSLQAALARWAVVADDVPRLADQVWDAGDQVAALGTRVKPTLVTIRDLGLRCRLLLDDMTDLAISNLTEDAISALHRTRILVREFPGLTSDLLTLTAAAEEKEGILYNLTPVYKKKYLTSVERHVKELGKKAREYKSLFAGTRALAAAGVGAARAWSDVAAVLRDASQAATDALAHATHANKLARGAQPMILAAERARNESSLQMRKGEDVLRRAEELRTTLEHLRRGAERVGVSLRGLGWQERELAARPRADVAGTLELAGAQADRVFTAARALYDEASELRRRSRYHLRRQLAELQKHGDTQLGAAQEHVSQIGGNTLRANEVAGALADAAAARAREHHAADKRLAPSTQSLRDKIARARHAADSISVSVTSKPGSSGCARAYRVTSSSSSVTRISLAISFDGAVKDGPLVYLAPEDAAASYLKLYVEDGRLKLSWDLGDGEGRIESTKILEATHDDADHTSYKIDIERVWNTVKLMIDRAGGSAETLANSTSGPHVTLRPVRLWLGAPPPAPAPAGLPGCAHALYYDDRRVGLWDFVEQPRQAQCKGCTQRWYNSARNGEPSLVWFGGAGYSELRRSGFRPSDRRSFSLAFVFRTRDHHALLFMTKDNANNRSLSVVMRGCRVVFRVEYSSSALEITAPGRHCHGRAVHVQAIRLFAGNRLEKGSLRVNGEETLGSPEPPVQSPAALPDLAAATYWVGGAPPGADVDAPPLLGCLGALTVDREGYDPLDTPTRHGVEAQCGSRSLRSVVSEGSGYVEVPAPALRRAAALGVSFRARAPTGVLLYRPPSAALTPDNELEDDADTDIKHYLALALVDGDLELVMAAGKAELRLRTNGTRLDDGRLHTVRLVRAHKQVELWVDAVRAASGSLPGNALAARSRGLFLAGVPEYLRSTDSGVKVNLRGFTGTLANLIVDGVVIGLETAVNWSGVLLGREDSEPQATPRTEPRALQAQPASSTHCTKTSSYTVEPGAVKFGDTASSHATLRLHARAARDLALALQLRTFRQDGLLLLIPGSKTKPRHYLALLLREGKLRLIVRGRRRRELTLAAPLADGTWRSVSVRVSNSRLVLASGGAAATAKAPRKVGLAGRIYVGGTPDRLGLPNIPDSVFRAGGLRGCIRRVMVNGRAEDLVRDSATHHRVGQCFPRVEPGAHFAGDAHAVWSSAWPGAGSSADLSAELRVQFRTAEPSGVLLLAARFVLELVDGKVVLTRGGGGGGPVSRVESLGAGDRALCDDRWHEVVARVAGVVSLQLDGGPERRDPGPGLLDDVTDEPLAPSPLYVGGIPEGAVEGGGGGGGGKENFKGCLRDVTVGGEKRDWTDMASLHNVLLDSCPIPQ